MLLYKSDVILVGKYRIIIALFHVCKTSSKISRNELFVEFEVMSYAYQSVSV